MESSFDYVVDYKLVSNYDYEKLKSSLVLPIKSEGVYLNCFVCKQSNFEELDIKLLIKK